VQPPLELSQPFLNFGQRLHCAETANAAAAPSKTAPQGRERLLGRMIDRWPGRVQTVILRLRRPALRWVRLVAGVLFIAGAFLSILPLFGIWMLPLGLVLSAEAPRDDDVINKVRTDLDNAGVSVTEAETACRARSRCRRSRWQMLDPEARASRGRTPPRGLRRRAANWFNASTPTEKPVAP